MVLSSRLDLCVTWHRIKQLDFFSIRRQIKIKSNKLLILYIYAKNEHMKMQIFLTYKVGLPYTGATFMRVVKSS